MKRSMNGRIQALKRKHDVMIDQEKREILVLSGTHPKYPKQDDIGNKSWGVIDYLTKQEGYRIYTVESFPKRKFNAPEPAETE